MAQVHKKPKGCRISKSSHNIVKKKMKLNVGQIAAVKLTDRNARQNAALSTSALQYSKSNKS